MAIRCRLRPKPGSFLLPTSAALTQLVTEAKSVAGYADWSVGVWLAPSREVARLNKLYRHKKGPTDILSFANYQLQNHEAFPDEATQSPESKDLGDMVLCPEYIHDVIREQKLVREWHYRSLIVHGIVHLLGYDHETNEDYERMSAREADVLRELQRRPDATNLKLFS